MLAMKNALPSNVNVLLNGFLRPLLCSRIDHSLSLETNYKRGYAAVSLAHSSYTSSNIKHNESTGVGLPIVILHGLLGSRNNWKSLSKSVAEKTKRQVFALDARNHGESPHSEEFTYNHMVADTVEFMNKQKIKKATLLGHSMGGRTSMLLALLHPELVESLIVIDISPKGTSPGFDLIPNYIKEMMEIEFVGSNLPEIRKHVADHLNKIVKNPVMVQFFLTNLIEDALSKVKWRVNLDSIYRSFNHIGEFSCDVGKVYEGPTLFIGGGNSDYIRKEDHELIKKLFPASEIKYIPGGGHWVHAEKPNEFLSISCDFINRKK